MSAGLRAASAIGSLAVIGIANRLALREFDCSRSEMNGLDMDCGRSGGLAVGSFGATGTGV